MKSTTLRATLVLLATIVLMAVPAVFVILVGWKSAGLLASLAAMGGIFSAMGMRWRGLIWGTIVTTIGAFLAVLAASDPWLSAGLMLAVALTYGLSNNRGLALYNFMFPAIVAALIGIPPSIAKDVPVDALITAGITAGSMLVAGAVVTYAIKKPMQAEIPKYGAKVTGVFTFNVALLFTIIGYVTAMLHAQIPGMWMTLTVVVIIHPYIGYSVRRGIERASGTILGFLIAIGVATAIPANFIYYAVGLIFVELAILTRFYPDRPYWQYVMFITPGVVLLSGLPDQVSQFADWRLLANVIAAVACLLLLGIERLIFKNTLGDPAQMVKSPAPAAAKV